LIQNKLKEKEKKETEIFTQDKIERERKTAPKIKLVDRCIYNR